MDLTEGSETLAKLNLTPGKYPKENIQDSEHGENLKSRISHITGISMQTKRDPARFTLVTEFYNFVFICF
jgi:hypothetical protein